MVTPMTSEASPTAASLLFKLPLELRNIILRNILASKNNRHGTRDCKHCSNYKFDLRILRVNRRLYHEARRILHENVFIKISSSWSHVMRHIQSEGMVPLLARGQQADEFQAYHLRVLIDTADNVPWTYRRGQIHSMITCLDDLDSFTKIWAYSNLTGTLQFNSHLTLRLDLRQPYEKQIELPTSLASPVDCQLKKTPIPFRLQERLILPFGYIKSLDKMSFDWHGRPFYGYAVDDDIKARVLREQDILPLKPEECLEACEAKRMKGQELFDRAMSLSCLSSPCTYTQGPDAASTFSIPNLSTLASPTKEQREFLLGALGEYVQAFAEIHIIITNCPSTKAQFPKLRHRVIHCDGYYEQPLRSGPHKGQHGYYARMMLRVKLVLAFIRIYIALNEHHEALYWGTRTICHMRSGMSEDCLIGGPGWSDWVQESRGLGISSMMETAWIFYYTAISLRVLLSREDCFDPRSRAYAEREVSALFHAAELYCPENEEFAREAAQWQDSLGVGPYDKYIDELQVPSDKYTQAKKPDTCMPKPYNDASHSHHADFHSHGEGEPVATDCSDGRE